MTQRRWLLLFWQVNMHHRLCVLPQSLEWETVIIDEAHRMKSTGSSTRSVIASMNIQWLLLLTGGCAGADAGGKCCAGCRAAA